jgi:hypothetical protein
MIPVSPPEAVDQPPTTAAAQSRSESGWKRAITPTYIAA